MKKILALILLLLFIIVPVAGAKLTVNCEVKEVKRHELLVTLSWNADIHSDKKWDLCDLIITLQDINGDEIYQIRQSIELGVGDNSFSGLEICDLNLWKRTEKYTATLDCVF
jgi:hypothetical protein